MAAKKLAAQVVHRVELADIALLSFGGRHSIPTVTSANYHVNIAVEAKSRVIAESEGQKLLTTMSCEVTATMVDGDDSAKIVIEATYGIKYKLASVNGLGPSHFEAFSRWIAIVNVWPYLREFVQSATLQMGLPAVILPLYRPSRNEDEAIPDSSPTADPEKRVATKAKRKR